MLKKLACLMKLFPLNAEKTVVLKFYKALKL